MIAARIAMGRHHGGGGGATPALVAHAVSQNSSAFTDPSPTSAINTSGANFIAVAIDDYSANSFDLQQLVYDSASGSLASVVNVTSFSASGTALTLNGTFTGGASNAFVGKLFCVSGTSSSGASSNHGYWTCTASSATSITVTVPGGASGTWAGSHYAVMSDNAFTHINGATLNAMPALVYAWGSGVVTGSTHVFGWNSSVTGNAGGSIEVAAFSGVKHTSDPFESVVYPGSYSSGTTVQAGSITSTGANDLILTVSSGLNIAGNGSTLLSVDSGFTAIDVFHANSTYQNPISMAYKISLGSAENPTWTDASTSNRFWAANFAFAHA